MPKEELEQFDNFDEMPDTIEDKDLVNYEVKDVKPEEIGQLRSQLEMRRGRISEAVQRVSKKEQTPIEFGFQTVGEAFGLIGDVIGVGIEKTGVSKLLTETPILGPTLQVIGTLANKIMTEIDDIEKVNPRNAENLRSAFNILTSIPLGLGGRAVAPVIKEVGEKAVQFGAKKIAGVKTLEEAIKETTPILTKKQRIPVIERGTKGIEKGKIKPQKYDLEVAELTQPHLVRNPLRSIDNINTEIERVSVEEIRPYLKANPRTFNNAQLRSFLDAIEPPIILKADATLEKAFDLAKQKFFKILEKHPNTMEGLWDARIEFDRTIKEEFGSKFFEKEKLSALDEGLHQLREGVNNFITDEIGEKTFTDQMARLNKLYTGRRRFAINNQDEVERLAKEKWGERHPTAGRAMQTFWKGLVWGTGAVGGGGLLYNLFTD